MELSKKEKTIKYVIYCMIIAVASLIQNVSGLWFEIGGARCFFLLPVSVILTIGEDEKISAFLGLFGGLLWDIVSAQHMGFNCIFLMLFCYFASALVTFVLRDTFWIEFGASGICVFLYIIFYWLLFVLTKGGEGSGLSFLYFYFPSFIYTLTLTPILYLLLRPLKEKLNKETAEG